MADDITIHDNHYLPGAQNKLTRYYFYLTKGLDILNLFRNLFLGILAAYIALKWTNVLLIPGLFILSTILLTVIGYYSVHHMSKITEWLNIRFGTHYGISTYSFTKGQYEILEEIRDILKDRI